MKFRGGLPCRVCSRLGFHCTGLLIEFRRTSGVTAVFGEFCVVPASIGIWFGWLKLAAGS